MNILLTPEREEFFKLHRFLILFTNRKYQLYENFKNIADLGNLNSQQMSEGIMPIREQMYNTENIKDFCTTNPCKLSDHEIEIILQWQNVVFVDAGYIVKHLAEYSVIMDTKNDNQLYGIKGITTPLPEMFPASALPVLGDLILLPYKNYIIYDNFIAWNDIHFGGGARKSINDAYKHSKAMKGIYSNYTIGDNISDPPVTTSTKEYIKYQIIESLKYNQFPASALSYAKKLSSRQIFELAYTAHFVRKLKKNINNNSTEVPTMYYAVYRENIVGVMPIKKELDDFCKKHYPNIFEYITMFKL